MSEKAPLYKKKYPIIRPSIVKELAHASTVSNLAFRVGQNMELSPEDCYELAVAGFLHDIGKLELAQYVRGHENETLVIEEMRYVRRHSVIGASILEKMGYSQKIVDMVRFHHENCDGTGYPMNLTREEIPLGARILRVCDVFAALTSSRPYRQAFDVDTAVEMMIEESKDYDVGVFLAFLRAVHQPGLMELLDTKDLEEKLEMLLHTGGQEKHGE
ncbi:MAG: HD domain-containing protein [Lachnospiraceae bacterium]|nr:HD domain-containing protein [Lachnospiraceae bacterium]